MGGTKLLDVPAHLLADICRLLSLPDHRYHSYDSCQGRYAALRDLFALSRMCRVLHDIALPIMLRSLEGDAVRLLYKIVARPDLAASVQILRLGEMALLNEPLITEMALIDTGMELSKDEQDSDSPEERNEFEDKISGRIVDAIITQLPQLEELEYHVGDWNLGETLSENGIFLQKLKLLSIKHNDTEGSFHMDRVEIALKAAPNLKQLNISMCTEIPAGLPLANLQAVNFSDCVFEVMDIREFVRACPKLEKFAFAAGGATVTEATIGASPIQILRELQPLKGTLRYLSFDFSNREDNLDDDLDSDEDDNQSHSLLLQSLKDFTSLETLVISQRWLPRYNEMDTSEALVDMLPKSLRILSFHSYDSCPFPYNAFLELSEGIADGKLPNLKCIELAIYGSQVNKIWEPFWEAGIQCEKLPEYAEMWERFRAASLQCEKLPEYDEIWERFRAAGIQCEKLPEYAKMWEELRAMGIKCEKLPEYDEIWERFRASGVQRVKLSENYSHNICSLNH